MNIIKINLAGDDLEIIYDEDGYFSYVKNLTTNENELIEMIQYGTAYKIIPVKTLINGNEPVDICEVRYARLMKYDVFIPSHLFIINKNQSIKIPTVIEPVYNGVGGTAVTTYKVVAQDNSLPVNMFEGTYDECLEYQNKLK